MVFFLVSMPMAVTGADRDAVFPKRFRRVNPGVGDVVDLPANERRNGRTAIGDGVGRNERDLRAGLGGADGSRGAGGVGTDDDDATGFGALDFGRLGPPAFFGDFFFGLTAPCECRYDGDGR